MTRDNIFSTCFHTASISLFWFCHTQPRFRVRLSFSFELRERCIDCGDGNAIGAASLFDFSNYPSNHPCFSEENKMVPGKMKDESCGNAILEFIGLRPKAYAFKMKR